MPIKPAIPQPASGTWTPAQWAGISTIGHGLLVSAAAGSGKTSVLAERCVYLVCDAPAPYRCNVDQLLVVTFTRDAAAEMRGRIESALRRRRDSTTDVNARERLSHQLALVGRAQISTIGSFCSTVLKQHFHVLGIDPAFATLDEHDALLMRNEVCREVFAERYERGDEPFLSLIDDYGDGNDDGLVRRVIGMHNLLSSVVDPAEWIQNTRRTLDESASDSPIRSTTLGRKLIALIDEKLAGVKRRAAEFGRRCGAIPGLAAYQKYVAEIESLIDDLISAFGHGEGIDQLSQLIANIQFDRAPTIRQPPPEKDRMKDELDDLKDELKKGDLSKFGRFSEADWRDGMRRTAGPCNVLLDLVEAFGKAFSAAKREARVVDFADQERLALDVLREAPGEMTNAAGVHRAVHPSPAARLYHRRFSYVLVDEYQDVNAVQDAILHLVSRECIVTADPRASESNLFCVGDVKQSIYRFRLADPAQFLSRRDRFSNAHASDDVPALAVLGQVIDLQTNFRSRAEILQTLNAIFERLMTKDAAEVAYDATQRLHPPTSAAASASTASTSASENSGPAAVELHILSTPKFDPSAHQAADGSDAGPNEGDGESDTNDDADRTDREAAFVAHRIHELLGSMGDPPLQVVAKQSGDADGKAVPGTRPLQCGDIAILLRASTIKAAQFAKALRAARIPVYTDAASGFFEALEIRDMLALLRLIDNPLQDIPMAAVLRGPIAALPDAEDCLARVWLFADRHRRSAPSAAVIPFCEAARLYAERSGDALAALLRDFFTRFDEWRELAHQRPLAEVIWQIYDQTAHLAYCGGLPDGEQRVANLVELHERSRQFGSFQRQGLRRFLNFLETLEEEADLGAASAVSHPDNAVRVMSVHKSKGLEFPVVFLCDLGKAHNQQDTSGRIVVDRDAGLGLEVVDRSRRIIYPSLASLIVKDRLHRQSLAEEMRVLYVAATRARDKLILVGTIPGPDAATAAASWRDRWADEHGAMPPDETLCSRTFLDWIGPIAAMIAAQGDLSGSRDARIELTTHTADEIADWQTSEERAESAFRHSPLARLDVLNDSTSSGATSNAVDEIGAPVLTGDAKAAVDALTWTYPFHAFSKIQATRSVSELTKAGRRAPAGRASHDIELAPFERDLPLPRCYAAEHKLTAAERGAATHSVVQWLDLTAPCDRDDILHQIARMVEKRLLPAELAKAGVVDVDAIAWLMHETAIGGMLRAEAPHVRRELSVYLAAEPTAWGEKSAVETHDRVMVRGRIDLLIPRQAGTVLVDLKTDDVNAETIDARADFYRPQIEQYRLALKSILGTAVREAYLVFLRARQIREG